ANEINDTHKDVLIVAVLFSPPQVQAEALANAYLAALERRDWSDALRLLQKAASLDVERLAPFPLNKFDPSRILGAGGQGVIFLCQDRLSHAPVIVVSLLENCLELEPAEI